MSNLDGRQHGSSLQGVNDGVRVELPTTFSQQQPLQPHSHGPAMLPLPDNEEILDQSSIEPLMVADDGPALPAGVVEFSQAASRTAAQDFLSSDHFFLQNCDFLEKTKRTESFLSSQIISVMPQGSALLPPGGVTGEDIVLCIREIINMIESCLQSGQLPSGDAYARSQHGTDSAATPSSNSSSTLVALPPAFDSTQKQILENRNYFVYVGLPILIKSIVNNGTLRNEALDSSQDMLERSMELFVAEWKRFSPATVLAATAPLEIKDSLLRVIDGIKLILDYRTPYSKMALYAKNQPRLQQDQRVLSSLQQVDPRAHWRDSPENYIFAAPPASSSKNGDISYFKVQNINIFGRLGGFALWYEWLNACAKPVSDIAVILLNKLLIMLIYSIECLKQPLLDELTPIVRQFAQAFITGLDDETIKAKDRKQFIEFIEYVAHVFKRQNLQAKFDETREILQLELCSKYVDSSYLDKRINGLQEIKQLIRIIVDAEDPRRQASSRYFSTPGSASPSNYAATNEAAVPKFIDKKFLVRWLEQRKISDSIFCRDVHTELIRQSRPILLFLADISGLLQRDIDNIWRAGVGKHEATQRAIFELIVSIVPYLKLQSVIQFFSCIESLHLSQLNSHTIHFIEQFTIEATSNPGNVKLGAKKRRWFGLDVFWLLMQDSARAALPSSSLGEQAASCIRNILRREDFESQRKRFIKACLENVRLGVSVPQSLALLRQIVSSLTQDSRKKPKKLSVQGMLDHLLVKYKLVDVLFDAVKHYKRQDTRTSFVKDPSAAARTLGSLLIAQQDDRQVVSSYHGVHADYRSHVTECLNFLSFVCNNTEVQLSFEQVMDLWRAFYEQATDDAERKLFTQWLQSSRRSRKQQAAQGGETTPLLTDAVAERLFREVILKLDSTTMTSVTFDLFFTMFADVNSRRGKLVLTYATEEAAGQPSVASQTIPPPQSQSSTKPLQTLGQPPSIEVSVTDNKNAMTKSGDVSWADRLVNKVDRLQGKLSDFVSRRRFLGGYGADEDRKATEPEDLQPQKRELKSMLVLENDLIGEDLLWDVALHAKREFIARSAIRHLNSMKSNYSPDLYTLCGEYRQLHVEKCLQHLQAAAIRLEDQKELPEGKDRLRHEDMQTLNRQIKRCLEILLDYVLLFAERSSVRGHGVASVGVPLALRVNAVDSKQRFRVVAQSTDTVARLAQIVASEINHSSSLIRLYVNGQALDDSSVVLDDLHIKNDQVVLAKVTDLREASLVLVQHQLHSLGLAPLALAISRQIAEKYQQTIRNGSEDTSSSSGLSAISADTARATEHGSSIVFAPSVDDQTLPMSILSRESNFQSIMRLLDQDDSISEKAWSLVLQLPTNEPMRDVLQGIFSKESGSQEQSESIEWKIILPGDSVHRLLYSLQIVDMVLKRSKLDVAACGQRFVALGGFDHLLAILMQPDLINKFSRSTLHKECLAYILKTVEVFLPAFLEKTSDHAEALVLLQRVIDVALIIPKSFDVVDVNNCAKKEHQRRASKDFGSAQQQADAASPDQEPEHAPSDNTGPHSSSVTHDISVAYRAAISQTISFLLTCIQVMPETAPIILQHPQLNDFVRDSLFCEFKEIRHEVLQGILKLLGHGSVAASSDVFVPLLFSFLPQVPARHDRTCEQYFVLLTELIEKAHVPIHGFDIHTVLMDVIAMIIKRPIHETSGTAACEDKVLVGLLLVCKRLLHHAQDIKPQVGSQSSVGFLKEIFDYIFEAPSASSAVHLTEVAGVKRRCLPPKCKTVASRSAAFELLVELVDNCRPNMEELMALVAPYIAACVRHSSYNFEPKYLEKNALGYVGLKNLGATCYANSLLQQLFMVMPLRRGLLSVNVADPAKDDNRALLYQFQVLLGFLQDSAKRFYDTKPLFSVYKDVDGSTLSPGMQQDANEFCNFFLDKIEAALKDTSQRDLLQKVFGGKILNQLLYEEHVSETEEPFFALSLEIKNKHSILESLNLYTQGEMLEGANQYYSDKLKRRVDALKRALIKDLPNVLLLHLKRFEYDYERMRNLKINDRCEFPMELDMEPYTLEGVFRREKRDLSRLPKRDPSYYRYRLAGVLVHTGTADSGHYYSFIMDRQSSTETGTEQWFEFNDTNVYKFDTADLEKECFGGEYTLGGDTATASGGKKSVNGTRLQRSNNAYILFYQRVNTLDKDIVFEDQQEAQGSLPTGFADVQQDSTAAAATEQHVGDAGIVSEETSSVSSKLTSAITALRFLVKLNAKTRDRQQQLLRLVDLPDYVKQTIWQDNALFYYDRNVFNTEFESFMWNFMSSRERLSLSLQSEGKEAGSLDDATAIELSLRFILDVLSHGTEAESAIGKWFDLMSNILERSVPSCRKFLDLLSSDQVWCLEALLRCPYSAIRFSFCNLAIVCIKMLRVDDKYQLVARRKSMSADVSLVKTALTSSTSAAPLPDETSSTVTTERVTAREEGAEVVEFMESVLALLNDTRYYPDRATELFQFLAKFSLLGYNERKYLVQKEIISLLVSLLSSDLQSQQHAVGDRGLGFAAGGGRMLPAAKSQDSMFVFGKQALHHIISLISVIIRFCETSALKNAGTPLPPKMMRRPDEAAVDIGSRCRDRLFHRPFFASLIIEGTNLQAIGEMVSHWSWCNLAVSLNFCKLVLESLREHQQQSETLAAITTNVSQPDSSVVVQNFLSVLEQLLLINDDIAEARVQQILDKYLEQQDAVKKQINLSLQLLNFLTRTAKFSELVKKWLLGHLTELEAICRIHGWALKPAASAQAQSAAKAEGSEAPPPPTASAD